MPALIKFESAWSLARSPRLIHVLVDETLRILPMIPMQRWYRRLLDDGTVVCADTNVVITKDTVCDATSLAGWRLDDGSGADASVQAQNHGSDDHKRLGFNPERNLTLSERTRRNMTLCMCAIRTLFCSCSISCPTFWRNRRFKHRFVEL